MKINIKNIMLFSSFLLISIIIYKQSFKKGKKNNGGKLNYLVHFDSKAINTSEKTDAIIAGLNLFDEINEASKEILFHLDFTNKESSFYIEDAGINNKMRDLAIVLSGGKGVFYNKYNTRIRQVEAFNSKYLINYNLIKDSDWEFQEGEKIIQGYKCNKAVLKKINSNSENLTAWYSKKLPYKFGPRGINNLPGLILELSIINRVEIIFTASNISFNNTRNSVSKPLQGIKITKHEFDIIKENKLLELKK